jgi:hypothetical protein
MNLAIEAAGPRLRARGFTGRTWDVRIKSEDCPAIEEPETDED